MSLARAEQRFRVLLFCPESLAARLPRHYAWPTAGLAAILLDNYWPTVVAFLEWLPVPILEQMRQMGQKNRFFKKQSGEVTENK